LYDIESARIRASVHLFDRGGKVAVDENRSINSAYASSKNLIATSNSCLYSEYAPNLKLVRTLHPLESRGSGWLGMAAGIRGRLFLVLLNRSL
jgi:hypothetical protein